MRQARRTQWAKRYGEWRADKRGQREWLIDQLVAMHKLVHGDVKGYRFKDWRAEHNT